jgi:hydrogenase-4 membrane subunit HyfE
MQTLLEITGGLLIGLALLHAVFPRYFRWREETTGLSLLTRQILHIHTFFIALTVFLMGLLCVTSAHDLLHTTLGRRICLGLGVFWGIRLLIQFFGYSSILWRGKTFETLAHVAFTILWTWLTALFLIVTQKTQ